MFGQELPIFPKKVRDAIRSAVSKVFGCFLLFSSALSILTVASGADDLQTWTNFSTGGEADLFAKLVDLFEYAVGSAAFMFVSLFLFYSSFFLIFGKKRPRPGILAMRVFIAAVSLSASLSLLIPGAALGGVLGTFFARDFGGMLGGYGGGVFGTVLMCAFLFLAAAAFRITPGGILRMLYWVGSRIGWLARKLLGIGRADGGVEAVAAPAPKQKRRPRRKKKPAERRSKAASKNAVAEEAAEYELPPPDLLERSDFAGGVTAAHRAIAASMEDNFNKYGIYGKVREIQPGPVVTRYDYEPEDGQRIVNIMKTQTDMKRAMATEQIRIALVPKTRYIGVELANQVRQNVYYRGLVSNPDFSESKMKIPLALGVEINGNPFNADLAKMPHILIAGHTGTGKSVFVQSIITSIVYRSAPDEVKLIIVDPKGVDFMKWQNIPHLLTPIVTDASSAINALRWSVGEMERRYKELQNAGVQSISDYNLMIERMIRNGRVIRKKVPVGTSDDGDIEYEIRETVPEKMPYIVMIMDEIADLMAQARKEIEAYVQRITQKARAAGIHLVAATQRPSTDVLTGVIKSNIPTRISFHTASYIDSMTCLDQRGAEMLLSCGDMLYSESGKPAIRIHSAFISNKEIEKVAKFLRSQGEPEYDDGVVMSGDGIGNAALGLPPSKGEKDGDLYNQAVEYVVRDKRPTITYIQRRLGIGYGRAVGLFEKMEANGIVRRKPDGKYELA